MLIGRSDCSSLAAWAIDRPSLAPAGWSSTSNVCGRQMVFCWCETGCQRRSTSSPSTIEKSSGSTRRSWWLPAVAIATERASNSSVLRPEWPDSRRVRAVSVAGASTTDSSWRTSCWANSRPRPLVFSTAQIRSGHWSARVSSRSVCRRPAGIRSCAAMASSASSTTAVCERLWGSIPPDNRRCRQDLLRWLVSKPRSTVLMQATKGSGLSWVRAAAGSRKATHRYETNLKLYWVSARVGLWASGSVHSVGDVDHETLA